MSPLSRVVRRRHFVGMGGQFLLAAAGRRRSKQLAASWVGAARRWRPSNVFQRFPKKFRSILKPQNFLMTFFRHRKLQQNKYTTKMASAARRQIIGGGAPINKSRRGGAHKLLSRRGPQAHGSTTESVNRINQ